MRNIMRNGLRRGFCFLLSMLFFLSLSTGVPVRQQQNLTGFIMAITAFADSDEEGQGSTDLSSEENGSSDSNTGSQAGDEAGTLEEENSGGEGTLPEETPGSEEGTLPEEIPGSEADTPAKGATTDEKGYPLNEIAALSAVGLSSPLLAVRMIAKTETKRKKIQKRKIKKAVRVETVLKEALRRGKRESSSTGARMPTLMSSSAELLKPVKRRF